MAELFTRFRRFVVDQALWAPEATLLVAVSGGPDSLCVLHLLQRLAPEQALRLHVAHLDHALRPESSVDAQFVAELAAAWNLPATVDRRAVQDWTGVYGGVEAAARAVRYQFLRDTAVAVGAAAVVTGHTADDQAETVIQRLLRGAGPTGLAAMRPRLAFDQWRGIGLPETESAHVGRASAPVLVRPLLVAERAEIEAYCVANDLQPRRDATNQSPDYLRNRVRGYILPQLKAYNPNIVTALGRTARIAADEDALLNELLDQQWPALAQVAAGEVRIDRARLLSCHRALRRRALRRAVTLLAPDRELGADHLDRMLQLAERSRGRLQLPAGLWMYVSPAMVLLQREVARAP